MNKLKICLFSIVALIICIITSMFIINFYVKESTKDQIKNINELKDIEAIVVLGASIREDGSLSPMLKDRLVTSVEAYNASISSKIIMSGDHTTKNYDEVTAMKNYAIDNGVSSEVIYLDHAGISTYDSIYRMKHIFKLNKIAIVTQEYHLYRALYIANKLGIEAYGIDATKAIYSGQTYRDIREVLARNKDFVKVLFKPKSKYLGDPIDINASGDLTN